MTKSIFKYAGIGLAFVIVVVAIIYISNRGSQIRLNGKIQQVRVQAMDKKSCVVIVDFRFKNPANYPFVVEDAKVLLDLGEKRTLTGAAVAAMDVKRLFDYYSKVNPELGVMYNKVLVVRDRIEPKQSLDRMICARFEIPAAEVDQRQRVRLRIQDVDRAVAEIVEVRGTE